MRQRFQTEEENTTPTAPKLLTPTAPNLLTDEVFWRAGTLSEAHLRRAIEGFGAALGPNSTAKRKVKAVRRRFQTREENATPTAPTLLTYRALGELERSQECTFDAQFDVQLEVSARR